MKTTEIFAELLIIGFTTILNLILLTVIWVDTVNIETIFETSKCSSALIVFIFVPLAYILGIVTDRIYIPIWSNFEKWVMKQKDIDLAKYYKFQIKLLLSCNDELISFMNYYSSRMRILRAVSINLFFTIFMASYIFKSNVEVSSLILFTGLFFLIGVCMSYYQVSCKYYGFVHDLQTNQFKQP